MDISGKAVLVSLSVRAPTGAKKDKRATAVVLDTFSAAEGAGNFSKQLFGDALKSYGAARNRLKTWFNGETLPWGEDGIRILPTSKLLEVKRKFQEFERDLETEREKILEAYDGIQEGARTRLGDMYREEDYPDKETLRSRFGMEVTYYPIPTTKDFRVDLSREAVNDLQEQLQKSMEQTQKAAMEDLWKRLHGRVEKLAEILGRPEGGIPKEEFLGRTLELCQSLKELNLWGDQNLTESTARVESVLRGVTEASLSQNSFQRAALFQDVDRIMDAMSGFMRIPPGIPAKTSAAAPDPAPIPIAAAPAPAKDYSGYRCVVNSTGIHYVMS